MKRISQLCVLVLVMGVSYARAADTKSDEAAIRGAIASGNVTPTDDAIFWSGAFKRPMIRPDKGEEFPGHELSKRTNIKGTTDVQRIEVAASGDLAYEFSLGSMEFDVDGMPPHHRAFKTGLLRVWKKVNGEWKIAAMFVRPLDIPFDESAEAASK